MQCCSQTLSAVFKAKGMKWFSAIIKCIQLKNFPIIKLKIKYTKDFKEPYCKEITSKDSQQKIQCPEAIILSVFCADDRD